MSGTQLALLMRHILLALFIGRTLLARFMGLTLYCVINRGTLMALSSRSSLAVIIWILLFESFVVAVFICIKCQHYFMCTVWLHYLCVQCGSLVNINCVGAFIYNSSTVCLTTKCIYLSVCAHNVCNVNSGNHITNYMITGKDTVQINLISC